MVYSFYWTLALWLFGWLLLPLGRHIFPDLPDGGLATMRTLGLAVVAMTAFWLAALHLCSLQWSPVLLVGAPLVCAAWSLRSAATRSAFRQWCRRHRRALLVSDAVFLGVWLVFLWIRARNPQIADLEKPMDAALLGALSRAQYLPFSNPWLSGVPFTNYYYFGPLMGSLWARTLGTPNMFAYNLVQPAFCALFVSSLWSLCAALIRSLRLGLAATALVALLGNFEPLRQIAAHHTLWPLDWWTTSRVIPNTINEYPAFTMLIGDAHAHFYAFALAAALFGLCHSLLGRHHDIAEVDAPAPGAMRIVRLILIGIVLGALWLTNTWDVPIYALLALGSALCSLPALRAWPVACCLLPLLLARLLALPYTLRSQPNIQGVKLELWLPDLASFSLLWGGMTLLLAVTLIDGRSVTGATNNTTSGERRLLRLLMAAGCLALAAPCCFYIRGVFGDGPLRHQDTMFKFGLQAWLLLGIAGACGALLQWARRPRFKWPAAAAFALPPLLCTATVLWQRVVVAAPRDASGAVALSLNAAAQLPPSDQSAINWLVHHAGPDDSVVEATGDQAYSQFARISSLSGVATPLGWAQHVAGWGAPDSLISARRRAIDCVYAWPGDGTPLSALHALHARYVFVGDLERQTYNAAALARLREALPVAFSQGDTFIARVP